MQENKKIEVGLKCSRSEEVEKGILEVGSLIFCAEKSGNNVDEFQETRMV